MKAVLIVLIVVCAVLAILYAVGLCFVRILIRRQDNFPTPETGAESSALLEPTGKALWAYNIPHFQPFRELPFEEIQCRSDDGLTLRADMLRGSGTGVTLIFFHGYKSEPVYDFAAMYDFYKSLGYNLIYVHMRAHCKSDGTYIGFGALDRYDVVKWTDTVAGLFPNDDIYLHGMSMGAASILQSMDLELNENVRGVIADCGYSDLNTVFRNLVGTLFHLPTMFVDVFEYVNLLKAGYGFREASSVRSVSAAEIPLLYICGDSDRYVPKDMALEIFNACRSPKKLLLVPGVGHAACYMCAREQYEACVTELIDKTRRNK
jgi:uncharacterized protein